MKYPWLRGVKEDISVRKSSKTLRRLALYGLQAAMLASLFAGVYYLTFWLRFEGQMEPYTQSRFLQTVVWVTLVKLVWFAALRTGGRWMHPITFYDLLNLAKAAAGSLATIAIIDWCILPSPLIPRSVCLFDWGLTIVILGGIGASRRAWQEYANTMRIHRHTRVFIVGAGEAGALLMRAACRTSGGRYRVVGFLSDDPRCYGEHVEGVSVLGTLADACTLARKHRVDQIFVIQGELPGQRLRWLIDEAERCSVEVHVLPSLTRLIDGSLTVQPRSVSIEDLLQRDPVSLDLEAIRNWIDNRVLLVTGSAGSIGSEICRQLLRFSPKKIVMVDRSETGQFFLEREIKAIAGAIKVQVCIADVLDRERMRALLDEFRPSVVFHAAAYKHVPLMESHPGEAVQNIVMATAQLADLAIECGVGSFVMISTDKAVCPTSVMGACKRVAELYVQSLADESPTRFVTVRFGNVLDSAGSVVQIFRQQIQQGGPVTVTHPDMQRFFMTIPEAAQLVIQAGAIGKGGHILTLDMGELVPVVNLARDMIRLSGYEPDEEIPIEFTGLRPGEKMVEELLGEGEQRLPTSHPKIMVAASRPCDVDRISREIEDLARLVYERPERILSHLQRIVPEYDGQGIPEAVIRRAA